MCKLLCNFRDSLLGPRQLAARNKEMKNYRRENLKRHLLDFCVHASLVLSTFSLVVRTELKTEPSRGNRALPHQKSICPIPHCDLWQLRSRCRTSKFAEQEKKPQLGPHEKKTLSPTDPQGRHRKGGRARPLQCDTRGAVTSGGNCKPNKSWRPAWM